MSPGVCKHREYGATSENIDGINKFIKNWSQLIEPAVQGGLWLAHDLGGSFDVEVVT